MRTRTIMYLAIAAMILLALSSCSSTQLLATWHDISREPLAYEKIGVVALVPSRSKRPVIEQEIAAVLDMYRFKGISTVAMFPSADSKEEIVDVDQESIEQFVREKTEASGIDALLVITLLDSEKERYFTEKEVLYPVRPYYGGFGFYYSYPIGIFPIHRRPYYRYYAGYYAVTTERNYYTSTSYFVESSLFDVASGEMIWTAQTRTTDPVSLRQDARAFATVIIEGMLRDQAIVPIR